MKSTSIIEILCDIESDVSTCWEVWTSPKHIVNWNFANSDWHCPSAENDCRTGGFFSWRMEAKDQSMGFDYCGTYSHVEPHQQIDIELEDKRKVTIKFEQIVAKSRVTERFEVEDVNSAELQKQGWQSILDNFKQYIESL